MSAHRRRRWSPALAPLRSRCARRRLHQQHARDRQRQQRGSTGGGRGRRQRRARREGRHRLLRPRPPTTAGWAPSPTSAKAEAEQVLRRRAASRRGHQRRQPADQPGRDVHQRQGRRDRAAAVRRRRADRRSPPRRWRPASRSINVDREFASPFAARATVLGDNYGMGVSAGTYICEQARATSRTPWSPRSPASTRCR